MGWASKGNGALLALVDGKFDVFLTTDQRISRRNKIEFLVRMLPELQRVLGSVRPGQVHRVGT